MSTLSVPLPDLPGVGHLADLAARPHLGRLCDEGMLRFGDRDSLLFEGVWHRTGDMHSRSARVAGGLQALGVAPGDRVVLLLPNCPEVSISYAAVWRAGAVVTPLVFLLTAAELAHVLRDSEATTVITSPEFLPKVAQARREGLPALAHVVVVGGEEIGADEPGLTSFASLEQHAPIPVVDRAPDDLGALMYTGGTTGRSKGVMLAHRNLIACGLASVAGGYVTGLSRVLVPLPLSHAFGMIVTVTGMMSSEPGTVALMRWFEPTAWLKIAESQRSQRAALVPSMLSMLLSQPLEDYDLSELRYLGIGASPLARELIDEVERRLPGVEVLEGYGCTESGSVISSNPPGARKVGTVGRVIPGYDVEIRNDDDQPLPLGEDGEICVRSEGVMGGYWKSPDATAVALVDGWLHTGDIGHLDADDYVTIVDRKKDLIIRGGFNVYPRDVEDVLVGHPAVAMAAVVGRPDKVRGEEVIAFVALRPGQEATTEELIEFCRSRLAANKYPREIHLVEAIPLTSVGKTDRKALRARLAQPA